jgi:hypothetical protein
MLPPNNDQFSSTNILLAPVVIIIAILLYRRSIAFITSVNTDQENSSEETSKLVGDDAAYFRWNSKKKSSGDWIKFTSRCYLGCYVMVVAFGSHTGQPLSEPSVYDRHPLIPPSQSFHVVHLCGSISFWACWTSSIRRAGGRGPEAIIACLVAAIWISTRTLLY